MDSIIKRNNSNFVWLRNDKTVGNLSFYSDSNLEAQIKINDTELYEIKHSTDIQFDFYYSQYMQVYDYIENQKLLGNGKKPTKIFLDKMVKESNSLDNNQNINLMKFYSHFFSIYDLDWFDHINNIENTLVDNNLEDISDMN